MSNHDDFQCVMVNTTPECELKSEVGTVTVPGDEIIQAAIETVNEMSATGSMTKAVAEKLTWRLIQYGYEKYASR